MRFVALPFAAQHPEAQGLLSAADGSPERRGLRVVASGRECARGACETVAGFACVPVSAWWPLSTIPIGHGGVVDLDRLGVVGAVESEVGQAVRVAGSRRRIGLVRRLPAMPLIETLRGPVTLSLEATDQLLTQVANLESGKPVARAFKRAGLGDPVDLDAPGKRLVVEAISRTRGDDVDPQLTKLRDYLVDELTRRPA